MAFESEFSDILEIDYNTWMTDLPDSVASNSIAELAIPGSHDSLSYTITPDSEVSPDAEPAIKIMYKFFGPLVRRLMYRWCVTQKATVSEQLSLGIRYFDIRLSVKEGDKKFYFVHGLYGGSVHKPLREIATFLNEFSGEVVVLDFQHFYNFTREDHVRLNNSLENIFESKLCPYPDDINTVTLKWMRKCKYQVIIIYRGGQFGETWPSSSWPTPWPNTMSPDCLVSFLSEGVLERPSNSGFVSQCVLTPTKGTVLRAPWAGLHNRCACPASRVTIPWLEKLPRVAILNVAISDFIHDNDALFPHTVISLNYPS